ncbi:hypothetical protein GJ744_012028 [Endocarpon pusillum]|uniref:Uncharacterized protein n=1 Tax=Endocarpon pusillum TaxID=364733 RepID=A0A8H7AP96_9EURO|nr:hypothetical protein GJ744_012028 [Endocarpon pusillum]
MPLRLQVRRRSDSEETLVCNPSPMPAYQDTCLIESSKFCYGATATGETSNIEHMTLSLSDHLASVDMCSIEARLCPLEDLKRSRFKKQYISALEIRDP